MNVCLSTSGPRRALALLAGAAWAAAAAAQPLPTPDAAAVQAALDRRGFGVGPIDGRDGPRTQGALADYARSRGTSPARALEDLAADAAPALITHVVAEADLAQLGSAPDDWLEASTVPSLAYESAGELLGELYHAKPDYLVRLNGGLDLSGSLPAGTAIVVPNVRPEGRLPGAGWLEIDCTAFRLRVYATNGALAASFPCSPAMDQSRIPTGELRLTSFAPNPTYVFDPANFPESPAAQAIGRKLILPPGPNSPVGVYWLSLSRPGFGIHGTKRPETIGRPESHGCFRLTNWDIRTLAGLVQAGTPVRIVSAGAGPR